MGHLGVVLYEYLGEEYPEVLGSILGALKAIVNVIGTLLSKSFSDAQVAKACGLGSDMYAYASCLAIGSKLLADENA